MKMNKSILGVIGVSIIAISAAFADNGMATTNDAAARQGQRGFGINVQGPMGMGAGLNVELRKEQEAQQAAAQGQGMSQQGQRMNVN